MQNVKVVPYYDPIYSAFSLTRRVRSPYASLPNRPYNGSIIRNNTVIEKQKAILSHKPPNSNEVTILQSPLTKCNIYKLNSNNPSHRFLINPTRIFHKLLYKM